MEAACAGCGLSAEKASTAAKKSNRERADLPI